MFGRIALAGIVFFSLLGCSDKACIVESSAEHDGKVYVFKKNICKDSMPVSEQWFLREGDSLVAHGLYRNYYDNGNLESEGYYKWGKKDSISKHYNKNGVVKRIEYRADYNFSGPQYEFYDNGAISNIKFVNEQGEIWFEASYDENGNVMFKGLPVNIIETEMKRKADSLLIGEPLVLMNEVPFIYKAKTRLSVRLQKEGASLFDTAVTEFIPVYNIKIFGYSRRFDKPGTYEYIAQVDFLDSATGRVINKDKITLPIRVYAFRK